MEAHNQNGIFKYLEDPRFIFLIDGLGGLLTFAMYRFVLPQFGSVFLLPLETMQRFSIFGIVYAIYSLGCWNFAGPKPFRFLGPIALANLIYCGISVATLAQQFDLLSQFDVIYLLGEKLIILVMVYLELRLFLKRD